MRHLRFTSAVIVVLAWLGQALAASGSSLDDRIATWYRPLQGEQVALSPDGERLAFTRHERGELVIYLIKVDRPERKFRIVVDDDRPVAFSREKAPARLRFLRWVSPTRLVFSPTERTTGAKILAPIFAVNADGSDAKTLAVQDDFSFLLNVGDTNPPVVIDRPTTLLDGPPDQRQTLYIEARGSIRGDDIIPTVVFTLDSYTGKLKMVQEEAPEGRYFYNRKGEPRLFYSTPPHSHRRTFEFNTGGAWGRWIGLDETSAGPDTKDFAVTVGNYFRERAFPVAFSADPNIFYFASNVGRDTYGLYAFDLRTKQRTDFVLEEPHVDLVPLEPGLGRGGLVFDPVSGDLVGARAVGVTRFTRWLDPELAQIQLELEKKFPQRTVELLQWDDTRRRFLLRVTAGAEPGRYHVFARAENVMFEVLRSAPWINTAELHAGTTFEFDTAKGVHLSGYITFPRRPRLNPSPLLIVFSENPMSRAQPGFDREAQVLAEMGFVVARFNHRGAGSFGVKHRLALRTDGDRAPVEDAVAVVNWIAQHHAIDRKRVATFGRGLGGYMALRTLQTAPDLFRCGIAINAPLVPRAWLQPPLEPMSGGADQPANMNSSIGLSSRRPRSINFTREAQHAFFFQDAHGLASVLGDVNKLTLPVMLVVDEPRDRTIASQNLDLRGKLRRLERTVEYYETASGIAENLPGAQAKLFREIEGFFNLNLYDFNVRIGPTKELK